MNASMLSKSQLNFFVWRTCVKVQNQATCPFSGICYANATQMQGDICSTCCESYGCSQGPTGLGPLPETSAGCYDLPYAPLRSADRRTPDGHPLYLPERTQHQGAPQPDLRTAEHKERLTSGFVPARGLGGRPPTPTVVRGGDQPHQVSCIKTLCPQRLKTPPHCQMIERRPRHSRLLREVDQAVAQLARRGDSELDPDRILSSVIP